MFFLFTYLASENDNRPATFAPYKKHAECSAFDRLMNRVCYALGLIKTLE